MVAAIKSESFEQYAREEAVHATTLKLILTSPLAYKHAVESEDKDTATLRRGRAGHTAVLEPSNWLRDYVLWDKGDRRGKAWLEFAAQYADKTILKPDEYEQANRIRDAVMAHPIAGPLFVGGKAEQSIRWTHERTGLTIKCRLDYIGRELVDLKTTRDPSPHAFNSTSARLLYPLQMSLYHDGAVAAGLGDLPVTIVAVQSAAPFDVAVYDLDDDVIGVGRAQYERALDILQHCRETNQWPGIAHDTRLPLTLPRRATSNPLDEPVAMSDEAIPY